MKQNKKNSISKTTNIPLKQFNKTYLKPHTGKRIKKIILAVLTLIILMLKLQKSCFLYIIALPNV
jgi:hypothetical protein